MHGGLLGEGRPFFGGDLLRKVLSSVAFCAGSHPQSGRGYDKEDV